MSIFSRAVGLVCFIAFIQISCSTSKIAPTTVTTTSAKTDSSDKTKPKTAMKPYKAVITKEAVSDSGVFTIHKVGEKYFYEIPDSLLLRDFLWVSRFVNLPSGLGGGSGQHLWFEKPENRGSEALRMDSSPNQRLRRPGRIVR